MRPKKRILMIDKSLNLRSVTRFVMKTWSYRVITSPTVELIFSADRKAITPIDLVIGVDLADDRDLCEIAASFSCPALVVLTKGQRRDEALAEETLIRPTMEQFRDAVKRRTARKRGPLKGVKRQPARVGMEAIAA